MALADYQIALIKPTDDAAVCQVIKAAGVEFDVLSEGFGPFDAEVQCLSQHYFDDNNSCYLVGTVVGEIAGGGGIAPFNGSAEVCELRKLFLSPHHRGLGLGEALTLQLLGYAKSQGFKQCYLDSKGNMTAAIGLYQKLGFTHLDKPLDGTIHGACDVWMIKNLN
jgi:putative acetyltransferase